MKENESKAHRIAEDLANMKEYGSKARLVSAEISKLNKMEFEIDEMLTHLNKLRKLIRRLEHKMVDYNVYHPKKFSKTVFRAETKIDKIFGGIEEDYYALSEGYKKLLPLEFTRLLRGEGKKVVEMNELIITIGDVVVSSEGGSEGPVEYEYFVKTKHGPEYSSARGMTYRSKEEAYRAMLDEVSWRLKEDLMARTK